jgi:UDP-N-acetylmuramoyl-L-alanyl-D-glutamate--2,6-diaminopimelate ligase
MLNILAGEHLMRYGIDAPGATHSALNLHLAVSDTRFDFVTPSSTATIQSRLSGRVNVYNLLAAMCAALARGLTLEEIASATPTLKQVPGRFEVVPGSDRAGFSVVVDYAHTDDALRNLISLARDSIGIHSGRVITVFGCGGDRDRTKRPKMGRAAAENSDLVIVTSDNPRSERPSAIIEEIIPGVRETNTPLIVEEDRRAAIERALRSAHAGDIVLLAGKGHEKVQVFAEGAVPFDDVAEASRILQELTEVRA